MSIGEMVVSFDKRKTISWRLGNFEIVYISLPEEKRCHGASLRIRGKEVDYLSKLQIDQLMAVIQEAHSFLNSPTEEAKNER